MNHTSLVLAGVDTAIEHARALARASKVLNIARYNDIMK